MYFTFIRHSLLKEKREFGSNRRLVVTVVAIVDKVKVAIVAATGEEEIRFCEKEEEKKSTNRRRRRLGLPIRIVSNRSSISISRKTISTTKTRRTRITTTSKTKAGERKVILV